MHTQNFSGLGNFLDTLSDPGHYQIQIKGRIELNIINDMNKGVGRAKEKMLFREIFPFGTAFVMCPIKYL